MQHNMPRDPPVSQRHWPQSRDDNRHGRMGCVHGRIATELSGQSDLRVRKCLSRIRLIIAMVRLFKNRASKQSPAIAFLRTGHAF
jgi:hypothetical protein